MCSLWEDYPAVLADISIKNEKRNWEPFDNDFGDIQQFVDDYEKLLSEINLSAIVIPSSHIKVENAKNTEVNNRPLGTCRDEMNQQTISTPKIEVRVSNKERDRLVTDKQNVQSKQQKCQYKAPLVSCKQPELETQRLKSNSIGNTSSNKNQLPIKKLCVEKNSCPETPNGITVEGGKLLARHIGAAAENTSTSRKGVVLFRKPLHNIGTDTHRDVADNDNGDFILKYVIEQVQNLPKEVYEQCVQDRYRYLERKRNEVLILKNRIGVGASKQMNMIKQLEKRKRGDGRVIDTRR